MLGKLILFLNDKVLFKDAYHKFNGNALNCSIQQLKTNFHREYLIKKNLCVQR